MEFSKQEHWSGLPCPHILLQGIFPTRGVEPVSLELPALTGVLTTNTACEHYKRFVDIGRFPRVTLTQVHSNELTLASPLMTHLMRMNFFCQRRRLHPPPPPEKHSTVSSPRERFRADAPLPRGHSRIL